ncbi:MAG: Dabb family protein [Ruegeria sp.]
MILHCVFFSFRPDAPNPARHAVLNGLSDLCDSLEGALAFESGPNLDFELKSQAYRNGFVIRFVDRSALQAYAEHPTHKQLGARLCDLCANGADGIVVFDLEVPDT